MPQLYPQVLDDTTLSPRNSLPTFLQVGVEGQMDNAGSAVVATPYVVTLPGDSDSLFGPASSLSALVKFLLRRGLPSIVVTPSAKGSAPNLTQRQAAWNLLEENNDVRLRLTDSVTQADLVALAASCDVASGAPVYHKQVAFGGLSTGTSRSTLISAAAAIASKRFVLAGPGIYDETGALLSGAYTAAWQAAMVALNPDLTDDLDTAPMNGSTGIELDANGMPYFRLKTSGNDFEVLLQGGVSPIRRGPNGAEITHMRMTYTSDTTYDALLTRLIVDQLFIDVKNYVESQNFLRRQNTQSTRDLLAAGVEALLRERNNWIQDKLQADGSRSYGVTCIPSPDNRQIKVGYVGTVIRNTNTIDVAPTIEIPV